VSNLADYLDLLEPRSLSLGDSVPITLVRGGGGA